MTIERGEVRRLGFAEGNDGLRVRIAGLIAVDHKGEA